MAIAMSSGASSNQNVSSQLPPSASSSTSTQPSTAPAISSDLTTTSDKTQRVLKGHPFPGMTQNGGRDRANTVAGDLIIPSSTVDSSTLPKSQSIPSSVPDTSQPFILTADAFTSFTTKKPNKTPLAKQYQRRLDKKEPTENEKTRMEERNKADPVASLLAQGAASSSEPAITPVMELAQSLATKYGITNITEVLDNAMRSAFISATHPEMELRQARAADGRWITLSHVTITPLARKVLLATVEKETESGFLKTEKHPPIISTSSDNTLEIGFFVREGVRSRVTFYDPGTDSVKKFGIAPSETNGCRYDIPQSSDPIVIDTKDYPLANICIDMTGKPIEF